MLGILVALAALILLGVIFGGKATPTGKCRNGICIDIHIEEPIPYDQPVPVTVTVTTDRDITGLEIGIMIISPHIVIEGNYTKESEWRIVREEVDTQARVPVELATTVRFIGTEGYLRIHTYANDHASGDSVTEVLYLYMTPSGGTLNLPTPATDQITATPAPPPIEPTPTPLPPPTLKP